MAEEVLSLSRKVLDRVGAVQAWVARRMKQGEAARHLGVRVCQVKRWLRSYRREGPRGWVSRRRGALVQRHSCSSAVVKPGFMTTQLTRL
jgi:hypothetical protein